MAGKFIVFEGIDGSGKSTQTQLLKEYLEVNGKEVVVTSEPTDSEIGQLIRKRLRAGDILDDVLAALFVADRLEHIQDPENGMKAHLEAGRWVISDRYYWSSYAYHSLSLSMQWVVDLNLRCRSQLQPDLTLYIDMTPEKSMERINQMNRDKDNFEKLDTLHQIRENYNSAFRHYHYGETLEFVRGDETPESVHKQVLKFVKNLL